MPVYRNFNPPPRKYLGFTLIELLVVIAVLGILVTIAIASFSTAQARGRDAKRKGDLDAMKKALEIYYSDNGRYPRDAGALSTSNGFWIADAVNSPSNKVLDSNYIKKMPVDPKNTGNPQTAGLYGYWYDANGWGGCPHSSVYILATRLENSSDPQAGNTVIVCTGVTFTQTGLYAVVAP